MGSSSGRYARAAALALVLAGLHGSTAGAQGTALLPTGDLAYDDIDRLADVGLVDAIIVGQRPYSRREIARLLRIARERWQRETTGQPREDGAARRRHVDAIVRRLEARFGRDGEASAPFQAALLDGASVSASSTDAARRALVGSLASAVEATIDPIANRRLGRPAVRGSGAALELAHRAEPAGWLALQLAERVELRAPRGQPGSDASAELLVGSLRARVANVALLVGRQQLAWAQGPGDGLFLASDSPALDLVSLSSDAPFVLRGPFDRLGPIRATLLVADLGPSRARSHSKLLAYKVSAGPRPGVEIGGTFMNHYGGAGGRAASLGDRLIDFLPFVDIFRRHNYTDTTRTLEVDSDKLLGVDGRVRIERLGGMVVAGELLIDDFDVRRIGTLFTWDGAQSLLVVLPAVAGPAVTVRLSAKHTGVRTYTHGALSNGITTRGRLLGDELGPDAKAFGADVRWTPTASLQLALGGRSAIYSQAMYLSEQQGDYFVIRRVGDASNELRDRAIASVRMFLAPDFTATARLAGERVRNADFAGGTRRDYAIELALRLTR